MLIGPKRSKGEGGRRLPTCWPRQRRRTRRAPQATAVSGRVTAEAPPSTPLAPSRTRLDRPKRVSEAPKVRRTCHLQKIHRVEHVDGTPLAARMRVLVAEQHRPASRDRGFIGDTGHLSKDLDFLALLAGEFFSFGVGCKSHVTSVCRHGLAWQDGRAAGRSFLILSTFLPFRVTLRVVRACAPASPRGRRGFGCALGRRTRPAFVSWLRTLPMRSRIGLPGGARRRRAAGSASS